MLKSKAIELLGGTVASAAKEIGVTYQAIDKWPDELPPRIADRVLAAVVRKRFPELEDGSASPEPSQAPAAASPRTMARDKQSRHREPRTNHQDKPSHRKGR